MQTATATKTAPPRANNPAPARTGAWTNPPANDAKPAAAAGMSPIGDKPQAPADCEALFRAAVDAINKRFVPGTGFFERLQDERPDLAEAEKRAFDRLNQTWRESGPAASPAFKLALRTWYELNLDAMKEYEDYQNER